MTDKNKAIFWLFILSVFIAASIPTTWLLQSLKRYRNALTGFEPAVFRPMSVRFTPHRQEKTPALPNLEFASFRIKAGKAKTVELVGDFNAWKPGTLNLTRKDGAWEVIVPLPPGRYHYLFLVDGKPTLDAGNPQSEQVSGQTASVRSIP